MKDAPAFSDTDIQAMKDKVQAATARTGGAPFWDKGKNETRTCVWGPYVDDLVAFQKTTGAGTDTYFVHSGAQYSVQAVTDLTGAVVEKYSYSAYGERTVDGSSDGRSKIGLTTGFTGRAHDEESGLMYFRNRMYAPRLGTFVSRDPMGYVDGQSLYRGYFVPSANDPTGQITKEDVRKAISKAREMKKEHAADLLEYWLNGTGVVYEFKDVDFIKWDANAAFEVGKNEDRFIKGDPKGTAGFDLGTRAKLLAASTEKASRWKDTWKALINFSSQTEQYFTFGSATLVTKGVFSLTKEECPETVCKGGIKVSISGMIANHLEDKYNWDRGMTVIPGYGVVTDSDMRALEGPGPDDPKPFDVISSGWNVNFVGQVCGDGAVWLQQQWSDPPKKDAK